MSLGGSSSTTTVQKSDPWVGVQQPLKDLFSQAGQAAQSSLPFYPGQTYADWDQLQRSGQQSALQYARNQFAPQLGQYQQGLFGMMNAPMNITQDPAVQNMMEANRLAVMDNLQRNVLPSIDAGAVAAGQLGGSRQGIAQGLAAGEAQKALAQANAQTALGAYDTASRAAAAAAGMIPGALQAGFTPAQTFMDIGGQRQDLAQRGISEDMARYYYPEQSEMQRLSWLNSILTGASPYAGQTTTGPGSSGAANALGGALTGYGLGTQVLGPMLGLGTTTAGGLGALGGLLAFSDIRLKKNIKPLGKYGKYNIYAYDYIWGGPRQVGVMAQEVQAINPDAVTEIGGYLAVDYREL